MNREEMYKVIEEFLEFTCLNIMRTKGEDYESRGDAFASIKANAERNFLTPERVQMVLLTKHMDAITTWIERGELHSEGIDERIADAVNMLLILYAYIVDEDKLPDRTTDLRLTNYGDEPHGNVEPGFARSVHRESTISGDHVIREPRAELSPITHIEVVDREKLEAYARGSLQPCWRGAYAVY